MKLFLKNILIFSIPLVLFFAPAFLVLWRAGEFYPISQIGTLARESRPILVGAAYSNFQTHYQLLETKTITPEILVLGNSHVGIFRAHFFKDPRMFYNAAHAIFSLSDFTHFTDALAIQPKILIVSLSQAYFNPDNSKKNLIEQPNPYIESIKWYDPMLESFFRNGGWWKVYVDLYRGKFTLEQALRSSYGDTTILGLRSVAEHYGFTNDGSDYFGNVIQSTSTQASILRSIKGSADMVSETKGYMYGTGGAPYGETISPEAIKKVREFLKDSKEKNIFVIGFAPAVAQSGYDRMTSYPNARYASSLKNLAPILKGIYAEYGFDFYDFSNPVTFGSSDFEMVGSDNHMSEKAYLRMFIRMAKGTPELQQYVDIPYLEKSLAQASSTFVVFPPLTLPKM